MTFPTRSQSARGLFVDSSAFLAVSDRGDLNFAAAQRIVREAGEHRRQLLTSSYVVAEAHALFLARLGRGAGVDFLRYVQRGALAVVWPGEEHVAAAREIIYRYSDKAFSLTDAISFVLMERLGIPTAFTFDSDFRQYGFTIAQP